MEEWVGGSCRGWLLRPRRYRQDKGKGQQETHKTGAFNAAKIARARAGPQGKEAASAQKEKRAKTVSALRPSVSHAAAQWGLRPAALPDLAWRADKSFEIIDGEVCALDPVKGTIRVAPDGLAPMTVAQWVEELTTEAPHLFEDSSGARAQGSKISPGPGLNNPFKKGPHFNLTQQMILIRRDPVMAARLKSAAD